MGHLWEWTVKEGEQSREKGRVHLQMPPLLLMLLGAGCPLFFRAGFSDLGAEARRRGTAWEGIWESRGKKKSHHYIPSLPPTEGSQSVSPGKEMHVGAWVEEPGGVAGQPGSVEHWGPVRQEPCSPLVPADFPSPLSWGSHPSGSLYFFWGQAPLGHRSCHTEQIKGVSEDHII